MRSRRVVKGVLSIDIICIAVICINLTLVSRKLLLNEEEGRDKRNDGLYVREPEYCML